MSILNNPYITAALLILGIICLIVDGSIKKNSPLSYIGGFAIFLFIMQGIYLGRFTSLSLSLFIVGAILLTIEAIVPGFGLPGIGGILFTGAGLYYYTGSLEQVAFIFLAVVLGTWAILMILRQLGFETEIYKKVILKNAIEGGSHPSLRNLSVGDEGMTVGDLRPHGQAKFHGHIYEVYSQSGRFISKGKPIAVLSLDGGRITVSEVANEYV